MTVAFRPSRLPASCSSRLDSLTGLRALAAYTVFVMHALYVSGLVKNQRLHDALAGTVPFACAAVSLFFVLSGFVLTWSARPGDTARGIWRRRYLRVFPNHLLVWALTMAFTTRYGASGQSPMPGYDAAPEPGPALTQMFLVHVWVPDVDYFTAGNVVTWSLACEVFFYLCFPTLLRVLRRIPADRLWVCALATIAAGLAVPSLAQFLHGPPALAQAPLPTSQLWLAYVFPPARLPEFLLGMILARIVQEGRWISLRPRHTAWLPIAGVGIAAVLPPVFVFGTLYAAPCGLLIASVAARDNQGEPSWLGAPFMVRLGDRSFAFYVIHYFTITVTIHYLIGDATKLPGPQATATAFFVLLPLAAAAAYLLHRCVEHPLTRRYATGTGKVARATA